MNKTIILILFLCFQSPLILFAQGDLRWVNSNGNTIYDDGLRIAFTPEGDMAGLCVFYGRVDFDPGPGTDTLVSIGNPAMAIWKMDTAGNHLWVKAIGLENTGTINPFSFKTDEEGNYYSVGSFSGTLDFDPGPGVQNLTSAGGQDVFVVKLDSNANLIWVAQVAGTGEQRGYGLHVDGQGNVYYCGDFRNSADFDPGSGTQMLTSNGNSDLFVSKLDSNGQFQWAHGLGASGYDYVWSMDGDAAGNIVLGINARGNIDYDPGPGVDTLNSPYYEGAVWRLNAAGQHQWVRRFFGNGAENEADMIAMDPFGNALVAGYFYDSLDLDPGPAAQWAFAAEYDDHFLVKLDTAGNFVWGITPGGTGSEEPWGIGVDPFGDVYIGGYQTGTVDYDPGPGTLNLTTLGSSSGFVAKYTAQGEADWAVLIDGIGNGSGFVNDIETGPGNQVYLAGYFQNIVDMDPGPAVLPDTSAGNRDMFFMKLGQCAKSTATIQPAVCDSFVSPSGLYTWSASGIYHDTLQNAAGCDSLITIQLTLNSSENVNLSPVSCGPYLSPAGNVWTSSGTYVDTLSTIAGCDSILHIQLTVVELNDSILVNGDTLTAFQDSVQYQWVNCDSGFTAIPGATQQVFAPSVSGNYAVVVSENGCADTSACQTVSLVGLATEYGVEPIRVYPNPVQEDLKLDLPFSAGNWQVELIDLQGRTLVTRQFAGGQTARWSLNGHPAGVYFVKFSDEWGKIQQVEKILIP